MLFRYERRGRENHIFKANLSMADVWISFLRSETDHRTELPGTVVDSHQQTRHKSHTPSDQGIA